MDFQKRGASREGSSSAEDEVSLLLLPWDAVQDPELLGQDSSRAPFAGDTSDAAGAGQGGQAFAAGAPWRPLLRGRQRGPGLRSATCGSLFIVAGVAAAVVLAAVLYLAQGPDTSAGRHRLRLGVRHGPGRGSGDGAEAALGVTFLQEQGGFDSRSIPEEQEWVRFTDDAGHAFWYDKASGRMSVTTPPPLRHMQIPAQVWRPSTTTTVTPLVPHRLPVAPLPPAAATASDLADAVDRVAGELGLNGATSPQNRPCTYEFQQGHLVPGFNLGPSLPGHTVETCKHLCSDDVGCHGFEFATDRPFGAAQPVYAAGSCTLQTRRHPAQRGHAGYENIDLYLKHDCKMSGVSGPAAAGGAAAWRPGHPPTVMPTPMVPRTTTPHPPASVAALIMANEAMQSQVVTKNTSDSNFLRCPPPRAVDENGTCSEVHGPARMTFYMYRAQGNEDYLQENVNMADLGGVMWYLHREVVASTPRKFHINRILRYVVRMKNTKEFYDDFAKQFGPFVAFDAGGARGRADIWTKYGFVVGCQLVDTSEYKYTPGLDSMPLCHPKDSPTCVSSKWYSLPGPCPEEKVKSKTAACNALWRGGACDSGVVTGAKDCTYHVEFAGQIRVDELEGIDDYKTFWLGPNEHGDILPNGNIEFDPHLDKGVGMDFWNYRHSVEASTNRMKRLSGLFKKWYPELPETFPEPYCS